MDAHTIYDLIDFENVQPQDVGLLMGGPFNIKIKVFLGFNQPKIPVTFAAALQPFGDNVEYIVMEGLGKNALDFHIAYYMGGLSVGEPKAHFCIVSKDTGFDPLINHMRGKKISAYRADNLAATGYLKPKPNAALDDLVQTAIADLVRRKASKPRTTKTLLGTLRALFRNELPEQKLQELFDELCRRGIVKEDGTKVSYVLPAAPPKVAKQT